MARKGVNDKEFWAACNVFHEGTTFEQYCEDIVRCLVLSDWHYSEEEAKERLEFYKRYAVEGYENKDSVCETAMDIGYSCG